MKFLFATLTLILSTLSCSKDQITATHEITFAENATSSAPTFYKYFLDDKIIVDKLIKDPILLNQFNNFLKDENISPSELSVYAQILGFQTIEAMNNYFEIRNQFYRNNQMVKFDEIENNLVLEIKNDPYNTLVPVNPCEDARKNCIIKIGAESGLMHVACAAADITIVGGLICHGLAIAYQVSAGNECNAQANLCNRNQ
jgi:hypothetical protein